MLDSAEKMGLAWPSAGWRVCFQPISSSTVTNAFVFCFQYDSLRSVNGNKFQMPIIEKKRLFNKIVLRIPYVCGCPEYFPSNARMVALCISVC